MIEIRHLLTDVDDRKEALIIATFGGEIIGTCRVQSFGSHISIARMYVAPEVRRQGVGRKMIVYVAAKVANLFHKKPRTILIGCKVKNVSGRAFWLGIGFADTGEGSYEFPLT